MADHEVPAGHVGVYNKTLVADTVDTVTFNEDVAEVEIVTDGSADIFIKFDGGTPTVEGTDCYMIPAAAGSMQLAPKTSGDTVVNLISSGTPVYSVAKAN